MHRVPNSCPSCASTLTVARLTCPSCTMQLEGQFEMPALLRLPEDDLAFVLEFVLASGSLKEMAKLRKQSYPTIRNRLNDIIARLQPTNRDAESERHQILDRIARGDLSVEEGARLLKEVGP